MASDLWNLILNIIAAFIYAGVVWIWKRRGARPIPAPSPRKSNVPYDTVDLDRRSKNLQTAEYAAYKFVFYFATFAALYLSITTPPLFKALFANSEVFLNNARFVGEYLPAIPIGKSHLQFTFFLISALLYFPLLFVAETITSLVSPLVDSFKEVTERIWTAITMLVFLVFCIPVAATSVWLFYDKTYTTSLASVMFFIILPFVFSQAQAGRR
ncbi:hypothetical protein LOY38_22800 [Pseudomonas sp. B21-015]|uniref:hypothetical protein n=1 Tax=Pseudomonas sp. B21-015 TaxID=2895473 RepID=UPI00215F15FC|nr:hypothetical protein [Pseudomonas sp. B21-015]UVM49169.1 hypothetical protein LOY38_22800 [Pseudomonas sp. B21-015]